MCVNFIQENILSEASKERALKATGMLFVNNSKSMMHFITLESALLNCMLETALRIQTKMACDHKFSDVFITQVLLSFSYKKFYII